MHNLDKMDKAILNELQLDCRQSTRELGKKLKAPATTIHQRVKRLIEKGIIKSFSAILNPEKIGLPVVAYILITRSSQRKGKIKIEKIGEALSRLSETQEVRMISGEHDALLKIRGKDQQEIGKWVVDTLWNMPEVERTLTLFVLHTNKDTHVLPLK